ncbi:allergin-1 [Urocitellus parryii]
MISARPSSLVPLKRMCRHLNTFFFWGIFSSVTFQKAVLNCQTMKKNEGDRCPICPVLPLLLLGSLLVLLAIILVPVFWLQRKYRAKKATRENVPKDPGDISMEGELYVNICETLAGTEHTQEIHYATPEFGEVAPGKPEACHDYVTDSAYSELAF